MYGYILRSLSQSNQTYVGSTDNFKKRFAAHNSGKSYHTSKYKPWMAEIVIWFKDPAAAITFERYLKGHAGRAFRSKHFETRGSM